MAITFINKVVLTPAGQAGGTTSAIDCTGANCLVAVVGHYALTVAPIITDSLNATEYTKLVDISDGSTNNSSVAIYVKFFPTVGASQTFTATDSFGLSFCSATFLAYSGVGGVFGVDQISAGGANMASTTIQPGSITPSVDGCVIVAGLSVTTGTPPPSINSGFTLEGQAPNTANYYGHGAFDLIQGAAAAVNPTMTYAGPPFALAAVQVSLRPAAPGSSFGMIIG